MWCLGLILLLAVRNVTVFNQEMSQWRFMGGEWQRVDKILVGQGSNGYGFALALSSRYARAQTIEATMTPQKRLSSSWAAAGICVFQDGGNFWRLALVEAPDGRTRYAELVAMNSGVWQAQSELRLKVINEFNPQFSWQWQTPYRLLINLSLTQIVGEVLNAQGQVLWRRGYTLDNVSIVRSGWLALNVQGMKAAFSGAKQVTQEGEAVTMRDLGQAVVVQDASMGNTKLATLLATELKGLGIKTETAKLDDMADPKWWQKSKAGVVVFPNGKRLPASSKEPLTDFLRQGGKLIVFGAPLFDEPMVKMERRRQDEGQDWVSEREMESKRKQTKPQHFLFEHMGENELKQWQHHASHSDVADRLSLESAPDLSFTHHALRMDFTLKGWAIFTCEFNKSPFMQGHSLTCLWAKGAPQTRSLLIEWREVDGTRWFAHVPLTTEWRLIVLSPRDFVFRQDSPTRGKRGFSGDRFNPQNARALVLGMEAPMPPGNHTIWVAGIGTAPDPFGDFAVDFSPPVLEALSPVYKLYPLRWDVGGGTPGVRNPNDAVAPVPRWRGLGFTNGERVVRWQPMLTVADGKGVELGTLVWLIRCASLPYPYASWLVFGSVDETFWLKNWQIVKTALQQAISKWRNGVWLLEAGTDRFTAYINEQPKIGAVVVNDMMTKEVRARFTVVQNGQVVYERTEAVKLNGQSSVTVSHDMPQLNSGKFVVRVQLLSAGQVVDELQHELVVNERPKVTDVDKITVKDGHFIVRFPRSSPLALEERRWFAFGINYWPRYVAGQEQSDYWRHWLDPTNYDPKLIEQDLLILRGMGMNSVSIQYTNLRQAIPLRDFLSRCHEHGIKVNLFIAGAHPLHFQPELVRQLIEAADLANQPAVFAYDLAWEPFWGNHNQRRRHENEWRMWLVEQYGNVENAERDWGFKLPRDEKDNPTVPQDEHLLNDGEWRIMAAAYRRFLDDFISRKYRQVCRFIRKLDPNHLLGARTGYGGGPFGAEGALPFDHTAGAKHLDFVSPEGWNLGWLGQADEEQFARAAFITAYARWAGKSKPVFWAEFGLTLRHGSFSLDWYDDEVRLQTQAKLYDAIYRLMQVSDADGAMGWWFPGGYRVDERSDFGIVNPDGTFRPAAEVAKGWSKVLMNLPLESVPRPLPIVPIRIDRDENARGPMALWLKHGNEVAKLVSEGKQVVLVTDGTSKTSDDCPEVAIGNTPWKPGKPPKFLNGEINALWVSADGQYWQEVIPDVLSANLPVVRLPKVDRIFLKLELSNTGEVVWLSPNECKVKERGIVVRVSVESGELIEIPIPHRVEPFADITLDNIVLPLPKTEKPATITVRLFWRNSPFGERCQFVLRF